MRFNKYSDDFGEFVKEIANDDNAEPHHIWACLSELESLGTAINNGVIKEGDVDLVFNHYGITKDILMVIVDKLLFYVSNELKKNGESKCSPN